MIPFRLNNSANDVLTISFTFSVGGIKRMNNECDRDPLNVGFRHPFLFSHDRDKIRA